MIDTQNPRYTKSNILTFPDPEQSRDSLERGLLDNRWSGNDAIKQMHSDGFLLRWFFPTLKIRCAYVTSHWHVRYFYMCED